MENINNDEAVIIEILETVRELILEPRTDISWSIFDSKDDLIIEIDAHIQKLKTLSFYLRPHQIFKKFHYHVDGVIVI